MDRDEVLIVAMTDGLQRDQPFLMNVHQILRQFTLSASSTNEPCGERSQPQVTPAKLFYKSI